MTASKVLALLWAANIRGVRSLDLCTVHRDFWVVISWIWLQILIFWLVSNDSLGFSTWKKSWSLFCNSPAPTNHPLERGPWKMTPDNWPTSCWPPGTVSWPIKWWKYTLSCSPNHLTALAAAPARLFLQTSPDEQWASVSLTLSTLKFQGRHINFSQELYHSALFHPKKILGELEKAFTVSLNPLLGSLLSS